MTRAHPILQLIAGAALAVAGFFMIGFSCPYTFVSTIMTGRIKLPGIWYWLPYKWVLALAIYLILDALYAWTRRKRDPNHAATPLADPLLFVNLGVGVAAIGFLTVYYPCPYPIDLWLLLALEVPLGGIGIPYAAVLALAAGLLLYAAYLRATQKRGADAS